MLDLRPDNALRHLCMWRPKRGWRSGGATRCSITEEVRRRAALQPMNDAELLVGWDVLALPKRTRVGSIEEVVYTGEGAAPLLRVVNASPDHPASAPGAPLAPRAREEHLVPFVREIVPAVDAGARVALLQAPPGLLELGSRRALLEGLRPQLLELAAAATAEGRPRYMPSRKALEAAERGDLVRGVLAAGGFLAVAQELGLRARRRPQGYWDSSENLDQELSEFVAASWAELSDDYSGTTYYYNQVTGRISWERPTPPQRVALSEEASGGDWLVVEDERDRVMPSQAAIRGAGRWDLHHAILFWGGYIAAAEVLDRPPAWPRPVLGAQALGAELRAVSRELELGRSAAGAAMMPTARDLDDAGRGDLLRAVVHRGGFSAVAAEAGLQTRRHARGYMADEATAVAAFQEFIAERALERWPTNLELHAARRHDLRYAVQLHGAAALAQRLGFPPPHRGRPRLAKLKRSV